MSAFRGLLAPDKGRALGGKAFCLLRERGHLAFARNKSPNMSMPQELNSKPTQNQRAGRMARSHTRLGARACHAPRAEGEETKGPKVHPASSPRDEPAGWQGRQLPSFLHMGDSPPNMLIPQGPDSKPSQHQRTGWMARSHLPFRSEGLSRSSRRRRRNQGPEGASSLFPARRAPWVAGQLLACGRPSRLGEASQNPSRGC